ncbi:hypothetical protein [Cryobacterium ruanii]|nr:hypothetical protein [Cryobacterium ruanii]
MLDRPALEVAPLLLGAVLTRGRFRVPGEASVSPYRRHAAKRARAEKIT